MESTDSSAGSQVHQQLPPGFRFHPTDEELVVHYLKNKLTSVPLPVAIITDVDIYKFDPWELPSKAVFGEQEWYFFSPRDRKYPNGARPNRAATSGYWKATGTDKPILVSNGTQKVGVKKALVFYGGKPPKGIKTNWIMHEYRLTDNNTNPSPKPPLDLASKKGSLRLDDWVLCRIYKKSNSQRPVERENEVFMESMLLTQNQTPKQPQASRSTSYGSILETHHHDHDNFFEGILSSASDHQTNCTISHQMDPTSSSMKPHHMSVVSTSSDSKRALHNPYDDESANKRFQCDLNSGSDNGSCDNTSFVSLLNQIPQGTAPFHANSLLGSIGDGVFRHQFQFQGMNWRS